jgi:hypothetical protein
MMKIKVSTALLFLVALLSVFSSSLLHAQNENGSLLGSIRDSSGKAIPGANVVITNSATAFTAQGTTNSEGYYEFPSLRVGVYTVKASAPGFSDAVAKNISLAVGGRQRIDLSLKVGATQTTVEVTDVALQVETEQSQRGQNITGYQTAAFPLVSRNFSDLLGLVTGSRPVPAVINNTGSNATNLLRAGAYNVNGLRSMFNNFILDGLDNNAYGESNQGFDNQIIPIPPDSVSQFEVITNNESAEYGRSAGATVNVVSRGGTNKFHGTVYEFNRNTEFNAPGFFKLTQGTTPFKKPTFNRNQFGLNLGGPIFKNHIFFFGDYEGFRQKLTPLTVMSLPTQAELGMGIYSAGPTLSVNVQNPYTHAVITAGTPITSGISNIASEIIGYFQQLPNLPLSGSPASDYPVYAPFTDNSDKGDLRFDWQQSQNSSWFLRLAERKETGINHQTITANPSVFNPLDGGTAGRTKILNQQLTAGYTHLFGANKVFDVRFGLSETDAGKYTLSIGQNLATPIPGLTQVPSFIYGGLPTMSISGGFSAFGRQSTNPQWQNPVLLDPKANFTWVKGHHSLKFGFEYEHIWMDVNDSNPLYGSFTFGGGYSAIGSKVYDSYWSDFLFGASSAYSLATYYIAHLRQDMDNVYAQDDWKINDKLTLNYGLRWEYGSPYSEKNNNISNFDPNTQTLFTLSKITGTIPTGITPVSPGGEYGKTLVNADVTDFAPRLGFAYAATPKVAIRGGFGMSYVHYTRAGSGDILAINGPNSQFTVVSQTNPNTTTLCSGSPVSYTSLPCYATLDQGFPTGLSTNFNKATANVTWIPKNTKDSYVESWYLSLQKELHKNILLDVAYVGNHGVKLQGFVNGNQIENPGSTPVVRPFSNWPSDITEALNEFHSNYNALQVRYDQRFVEGLTLLNSFTWSHALDNASESLSANTPSPQDGTNLNADYGQSDYNLPLENVTSLVYDLPFGHGRHYFADSNALIDSVIGGWQVSIINTAQMGTPFNLTYTPASGLQVSPQIPSGSNYRGANSYRPNRNPGVPLILNQRLANGQIEYVNWAALSGPVGTPFGNIGRNPVRTPSYEQTDFALIKRFVTPIQNLKIEFRGEAYNILNKTNYYLPGAGNGNMTVASGANATAGGTISSTYEPRILQLGLKILY